MVLQLRCNCNSRVSNCLTVARELYTCGIAVVWSLYSAMFVCICGINNLLAVARGLYSTSSVARYLYEPHVNNLFVTVCVMWYNNFFCNCRRVCKYYMNVECRDVSECIINGVASARELYILRGISNYVINSLQL